MIYQTDGIVLKTIQYSDTSNIVKIFTKEFGIKSYIIKGGRKRTSKLKSNIFQHLNILNLQVYDKKKKNIQTVSEAGIKYNCIAISNSIVKTALLLYMCDILNLTLKEEEENRELYDFIENKILELEAAATYSSFHLKFMIELSGLLGFMPLNNHSVTNKYFSFQKGYFVALFENDNFFLNEEDSHLFSDFLKNYDETFNKQQRLKLLKILVSFYETHLLKPETITSHKIFADILG